MKRLMKYRQLTERLMVGCDTGEWYLPTIGYVDGCIYIYMLCFQMELRIVA